MTVWQQFLDIVREECGSRIVETWFKAINLVRWDMQNQIVYLQAPNAFVQDWVQNHYMAIIQLHIGRLLHVNMPRIQFVNDQALIVPVPPADHNAVSVVKTPLHVMPARTLAKSNDLKVTGARKCVYLNRNHLFETFVVGPSNSLAYAAAHAVTERLGQLYNPLFIYGQSGLGKTHLLHAIGNEVRTKYKEALIVYQTADRFVSEFISAIRFDRVHKFKEKYQNIDLLLIDDIQFISNKEQTQEAFFHIFNALYESHKQIVCSSDMFPLELTGIAERLLSRFVCGMVADVHIPDIETKVAILKKKAAASGQEIDDDVAYYIAQHASSSIRELEGALVRVLAHATLMQQPLSLALVVTILGRGRLSLPEQSPKTVDIALIADYVTRYYQCSLDDLRSKNRSKKLAQTRQVTMFLMKKLTDTSLRIIGEFLGDRDHSTVLHALERVQEQLISSTTFKQQIENIEREIQSSVGQ